MTAFIFCQKWQFWPFAPQTRTTVRLIMVLGQNSAKAGSKWLKQQKMPIFGPKMIFLSFYGGNVLGFMCCSSSIISNKEQNIKKKSERTSAFRSNFLSFLPQKRQCKNKIFVKPNQWKRVQKLQVIKNLDPKTVKLTKVT